MDQTSINREFVKRHFEAVNRRDVQTVLGNMRPDLYDHELEGDHKNDLQEGAQRLQMLMKQVLDAGQAELAALICPRNYVHKGGVWRVFETARQVLRSFVHVTGLPPSKATRLALIGCTQEMFMNGGWTDWDKEARSEFLKLAGPHFQNL